MISLYYAVFRDTMPLRCVFGDDLINSESLFGRIIFRKRCERVSVELQSVITYTFKTSEQLFFKFAVLPIYVV